ncbi:MAG: hypothetical protein QXI12_10980 [Candidatus Methanomethyliaceae archaeon]
MRVEFQQCWGRVSPEVVASWEEGLSPLLSFSLVPCGAPSVSSEHEPSGAVHPGDAAGDEGAGSPVPQPRSGGKAGVLGVRASRGQMGKKATQVHGAPGGAGKDVSGRIPSATDNDTNLATLPLLSQVFQLGIRDNGGSDEDSEET